MNPELEAGITAMLDTNRVKFGEVIDALMAQKAAEAIEARREEMAQVVFDFDASSEEVEEPTEEIEETEDEELNNEE